MGQTLEDRKFMNKDCLFPVFSLNSKLKYDNQGKSSLKETLEKKVAELPCTYWMKHVQPGFLKNKRGIYSSIYGGTQNY